MTDLPGPESESRSAAMTDLREAEAEAREAAVREWFGVDTAEDLAWEEAFEKRNGGYSTIAAFRDGFEAGRATEAARYRGLVEAARMVTEGVVYASNPALWLLAEMVEEIDRAALAVIADG